MTQPYEKYERTSVPVPAQVTQQLGQEACWSVVVGGSFEEPLDDEAVLTDRNLNRLLQLKELYRHSQYGGPSEVYLDIHRNLGVPARRLAREGVDLDEYPSTTSDVD